MRPVVRDIPPIVQIGIGAVIGLVAFGIPFACGGAAQRLPALIQCKVDAVDSVLPEEPGMLTIYDAIDIWQRVRACRRVHTDPDAGSE